MADSADLEPGAPSKNMKDLKTLKSKNCPMKITRNGLIVANEPDQQWMDANVDKLQQADWGKVRGFRISCQSDEYDPKGKFGGLCVWTTPKPTTWNTGRIKPGYVYIKNTTTPEFLKDNDSKEGVVHGKLLKMLSGMEPSDVKKQNYIVAGFAIINGVFKPNSSALNTNTNTPSTNTVRSLHEVEEKYIKAIVERWKKHGKGKTYMMGDLGL